jgi:hypothetical protein
MYRLTQTLSAFLISTAFLATATHAQTSKIAQSEIRLEPAGAAPALHDQFGSVVAMSANGNTLAISGLTRDEGPISEVGAVFIYDRKQGQWTQTATLFPSDPEEDEVFAFNVAISEDGNTVVATGLLHSGLLRNQGAVYVFERTNGTWMQRAELLSPTPGASALFGGWGIGISGNTIAAGDIGNAANGFVPGVDIFTRVNGAWQFSTTIQLPDDFDFSPTSVALNGNTLAVGAGFDGSVPGGTAYVFTGNNASWTLQAKLAPSDPTQGSAFGTLVALDGNRLLVNAPAANGAAPLTGAAYVFTKQDHSWTQQAKLTAFDGVGGDGFSSGIALNGGTAAIGGGSHGGATYLFQLNDGQWTQFAELTASDVGPTAGFGGSVALRNGTLLVGAFGQHPQPNNAPYPEGEAYIYKIN